MRPSYSEKTDRADLDPEYRPLAPGPKCGKLQVIVQLQQLSDLGVAISIDDFGTGFSFLSYVKRLPVRALVCGRHIFGRHFPFRVAQCDRNRARRLGSANNPESRLSACHFSTVVAQCIPAKLGQRRQMEEYRERHEEDRNKHQRKLANELIRQIEGK